MELGNEIGQKIRSAIKAKLVDLGAYVDDELPDYVMVMVANKKTQNQMISDLNLFLGSNTAKFTTWLHGLLEKLLSITLVDENKITEAEANTKTGSKDSSKSKSKREVSSKKEVQKSDSNKDDRKENQKLLVGEKRKLDKKIVEEEINIPDEDKPILKINPEQNEFENESQTIQEIATTKKRKLSEHDLNKQIDYPRKSVVSKVNSVINSADEKSKNSTTNLSSVVSVTERKTSLPLTMQPSKVLLMKAMQQAERSVTLIKQKLNAENKYHENRSRENRAQEDSISDLNVRLTNRRRQKSDTHATNYSKGSRHVEVENNKTRIRIAERLNRSRSRSKRRSAEYKRTEKDQNAQSDVGLDSRCDKTKVRTNGSGGNDRKSSKTEKINADTNNIAQSSESKKVVENGVALNDANSSNENKKDSDVEIIGTEFNEIRRVRRLEVNTMVDEDAFGQSRMVMLREKDADAAVVPADDGEDEDDSDTSDEDVIKVGHRNFISRDANKKKGDTDDANKLRKMLMKQKNNKTKPRFIVTMDSSMLLQEGMYVPSEGSDPMVIALNETQMLEYVTGHTTDAPLPSTQPQDEEMSWSSQRCKFWPSCKNGEACLFEHPSIQCKTFPNCRFGENCLFIHPPCKFASACTNMHCIYAHTGPRNLPPILSSIQDGSTGPLQIIGPRIHAPVKPQNFCKFFPNCLDMDCKFIHPKPCRFGAGCHQKNICPFKHPSMPSKESLKWQAGKDLLTTK